MTHSKAIEAMPVPMPGLDRRLILAGQRPLRAAAEAQGHALQRLGRLYDEGLRFMTLRLEANRSAVRQFAGCHSMPETVSAWTAYLDDTVRQYSEEFERVASLYSDQAREVIDEVQHEVAESIAVPTDAAA